MVNFNIPESGMKNAPKQPELKKPTERPEKPLPGETIIEKEKRNEIKALKREVTAFFASLPGVEDSFRNESDQVFGTYRFRVDTSKIPSFGDNEYIKKMKGPMILDVRIETDDSGGKLTRTFIVERARSEFDSETSAQMLVLPPGEVHQPWILDEKMITISIVTDKRTGTEDNIRGQGYESGFSSFYQKDEKGGSFTNPINTPSLGLKPLTEAIHEMNRELMSLHKDKIKSSF